MSDAITFVGMDVHQHSIDLALHFVYEAGPCGYGIYRHLRAAGLACAVVAPAQVPKRAADRIKTDRRDSRTWALQHRAGTLRPIYVPDENDEAMPRSRPRQRGRRPHPPPRPPAHQLLPLVPRPLVSARQ